jgi:nifR3 family TIM-barrel protein
MDARIENLTQKKLWLAPLAGYTDSAFRTICKECGADVVVSEMMSVDGLLYNRDKTIKYANFTEQQRPFGIQLFGSEPEIFQRAIEYIIPIQPDFIDLNMGCPVKKVVKRGAGSALMKDTQRAAKIVEAVKAAVYGKDILLSVKFRSGWDANDLNFLRFGTDMTNAGADMICLHPRTRSEMFGGKSNWDHIRLLKENLSIPIIGNGDIASAEDAIAMFEKTSCDSVMIGRGVLGKPWLFSSIRSILNRNEKIEPDNKQKLKIIKRYISLIIKDKGGQAAIREMRSQLSYFTKGYADSAKFRRLINKPTGPQQIIAAIEELFSEKDSAHE